MINPVLRREAITSLRGWRSYGSIAMYLIIMCGGAAIFFNMATNSYYNFSFSPEVMSLLYIVLASIQITLVVLSVPALAAGSISGERERQTLDLLLVTKLSPLSIVLGKLMSSIAFILLLMCSALPVFSVAFYFGNVSVGGILLIMLFTLSTTFMLGGISIFLSCIYKKTVISIMIVYIIVGILCFGTILIVILPDMLGLNNIDMNYSDPQFWDVYPVIVCNPIAGFGSLIDGQMGMGVANGFMEYSLEGEETKLMLWLGEYLWLIHMIFQIVVGWIFVFLATKFVNPVRDKKYKKQKKEKKQKGGNA